MATWLSVGGKGGGGLRYNWKKVQLGGERLWVDGCGGGREGRGAEGGRGQPSDAPVMSSNVLLLLSYNISYQYHSSQYDLDLLHFLFRESYFKHALNNNIKQLPEGKRKTEHHY